MNLHEYQGKEIFAKYDLPVSKGKVVTSLDELSKHVLILEEVDG